MQSLNNSSLSLLSPSQHVKNKRVALAYCLQLRIVKREENITEMPIKMSSEDFAYFLLNSPDGVFVRLGAGEDLPPLHNSKFLPPDEIIPAGIKYMTAVALEALKK